MDKIAIIGMGCLFPEAQNPEQFWDNLIKKRDVTSNLRAEDLGTDPQFYFHPQPGVSDKICYCQNGHIRNFQFDPQGYHLDRSYLESLDRIYQWSLYAAGQAIQDSGYRHDSKLLRECGVILGNPTFPTQSSKQIFSAMHHKAMEDYIQRLLHRNDFALAEPLPDKISDYNAWTVGLPSRIVAQALGLHGPCYAVDAACATSIYVIQLAIYYLLTGQAKMMLVGATCCPDYLYVNHGFNILRAFPHQGQCLPFDTSSQGIKIGEGTGFLVLKRYRDAVSDGDRIRAIVENIGLSADGSGQHILTPSSAGQILALERAYEQIARQVDYVECHATGTPLGDKTEMATLEQFFNDIPLLGGNKANIGHMLTVAAMASIIKVIMSMEQAIIPATIGVKNAITSPNKRITFRNIVLENRAWPQSKGTKIAGINAFGFGGVNSHLVLTSPPSSHPKNYIAPRIKQPETAIAIVGMHGQWGNLDTLEALNDTIYHCRQNFYPLSPERWMGVEQNRALMEQFGFRAGKPPHGSYCDSFELDCIRFKLPPQEVDVQLFNHLLMLHVADRALQDAGFSMNGERRNVAVLIGSKMDWANHRRLTRCELSRHLQQKLQQAGIDLQPYQIKLLESVLQDSICPPRRFGKHHRRNW